MCVRVRVKRVPPRRVRVCARRRVPPLCPGKGRGRLASRRFFLSSRRRTSSSNSSSSDAASSSSSPPSSSSSPSTGLATGRARAGSPVGGGGETKEGGELVKPRRRRPHGDREEERCPPPARARPRARAPASPPRAPNNMPRVGGRCASPRAEQEWGRVGPRATLVRWGGGPVHTAPASTPWENLRPHSFPGALGVPALPPRPRPAMPRTVCGHQGGQGVRQCQGEGDERGHGVLGWVGGVRKTGRNKEVGAEK